MNIFQSLYHKLFGKDDWIGVKKYRDVWEDPHENIAYAECWYIVWYSPSRKNVMIEMGGVDPEAHPTLADVKIASVNLRNYLASTNYKGPSVTHGDISWLKTILCQMEEKEMWSACSGVRDEIARLQKKS